MPELVREEDPDVLLAIQAANVAAAGELEQSYKRQAQWIVHMLAEAWKS